MEMSKDFLGKSAKIIGIFAIVWLAIKYLLPVLLPFALGSLLALAAEPLVSVGIHRLNLRRPVASGVGVSATLVILAGIVWFLGALVFRELTVAARAVPDVGAAVQKGMTVLEDWLIHLADRTPEGIRPVLQKTVLDTFDGGSAIIDRVTEQIPGMLASAIGWVSESVLTLGTGIVAGFLISTRLPGIQEGIQKKLPEKWRTQYLPGLKRIKTTLGGWFRAQIKLMLVTWGILCVGFLLLRVPYGLMWAGLIALVDAVPVLGTGTVLLPWAAVEILQGQYLQGAGLLAMFGAAWLARTVLEPRLVGRHLGIDPLITLCAFYVGFRVWGIPGMILAPLLVAMVKGAMDSRVQK